MGGSWKLMTQPPGKRRVRVLQIGENTGSKHWEASLTGTSLPHPCGALGALPSDLAGGPLCPENAPAGAPASLCQTEGPVLAGPPTLSSITKPVEPRLGEGAQPCFPGFA